MNEGLKILAERVKTNPEEFIAREDKWWEVKKRMEDDRFPWDDEEKKVIDQIHNDILEAREKALRDNFTALVMETLLGEEEPMPVPIDEEPQPLVKRKHVTRHEFDALKLTDPKLRQQLLRAMEEYRKEHGEL